MGRGKLNGRLMGEGVEGKGDVSRGREMAGEGKTSWDMETFLGAAIILPQAYMSVITDPSRRSTAQFVIMLILM